MDVVGKQTVYTIIVTLLTIGVAWVWKLNSALKGTPPAVSAASPHRWTEQEIKDTYRRIKANPIDWAKHLPPKLDRRYIITGGSGGVGGQIILHLLARGQSPESIRIVDFRKPDRPDMTTGPASQVDFAQADITSPAATSAAFAKPWPASVARFPLTVFHTAAIIAPSERSPRTYERVRRVNVDGTQHVLDAARQAGATVFVATSSGSVAYRPVRYWGNPFRRWPRGFWQRIDEADFDRPLRPHAEFFGNYAHAKAVAERLVAEANAPGFRTGIVRPTNGIYGNIHTDLIVGECLRAGTFPSWVRNIIQNFVHAGNVSLAHLCFEAALLEGSGGGGDKEEMPKCAGRPFTVVDDGPPPAFDDLYHLLGFTVDTTRVKVVYLQPAILLILAHIVECVDLASRMPVLRWILPRPRGQLAMLQPAVFTASTHHIGSDAAARRSVEEGGIGYVPACNSMEGFCQEVLEWNTAHQGETKQGSQSAAETLVKEIKNVGAVPAGVGA